MRRLVPSFCVVRKYSTTAFLDTLICNSFLGFQLGVVYITTESDVDPEDVRRTEYQVSTLFHNRNPSKGSVRTHNSKLKVIQQHHKFTTISQHCIIIYSALVQVHSRHLLSCYPSYTSTHPSGNSEGRVGRYLVREKKQKQKWRARWRSVEPVSNFRHALSEYFSSPKISKRAQKERKKTGHQRLCDYNY